MIKVAIVIELISLFTMIFSIVKYCVSRDTMTEKMGNFLLKVAGISAAICAIDMAVIYVGVARIIIVFILELFDVLWTQ